MSFRATTVIPDDHVGPVVQLGGYVYALGGMESGSAVATVRYATIDSEGTIGAWSTTTALPAARAYHGAVVVHDPTDNKDYIVVFGGRDSGGTVQTTVYWTTQGASGALAAWTTASAGLPTAKESHGVAVVGEYVFAIGGAVAGPAATTGVAYNTIRRIINNSSWTAGTVLPAARTQTRTCSSGLVLYVVGGDDGGAAGADEVYRGVIKETASGTLTITWTHIADAPANVFDNVALAYDDHLYSIGGWNGTTRSAAIYRAAILADGSIGNWTQASALSAARRQMDALMYEGVMVVFGGIEAAAVDTVEIEDTPTFAKLVAKNDFGLVKKLHVYIGGSIQYRYCDVWFDDGTDHDPRLASIGNFQRGLGTEHYPQAADVSVVLKNSDQEADWWVDRDTVADAMLSVCRLYVGAYSLSDSTRTIFWKHIGEFNVTGSPRRDSGSVYFSLTETSRAQFSQPIQTPSIRDWRDSGIGPLNDNFNAKVLLDDRMLDTQIPLVFGPEELPLVKVTTGAWWGEAGEEELAMDGAILVAFASLKNAGECLHLYAADPSGNGRVVEVPATRPDQWAPARTVWTKNISGPVTKDGRDWYICYIEFSFYGYVFWFIETFGQVGGPFPEGSPVPPAHMQEHLEAVESWTAIMSVGSSILAPGSDGKVSPEAVLRDIVGAYTGASYANVEPESFKRLEAGMHRNAYAAGRVSGSTVVRDVVGGICSSFDIDAYTDWRGRIAITGPASDFNSRTVDQSATIFELDEEEIRDFTDGYPSGGQRWALANRIYYDGIKESILNPRTKEALVSTTGPYDNGTTELGTGRWLEGHLGVSWRTFDDAARGPWGYRSTESIFRPVVSFTTTLRMLAVDLGAYFRLTWTRNLSTPYVSTLFKVEDMEIDLTQGFVRVTAVWQHDDTTIMPYLFDDKTLLQRVASTGTATVVDSDATVTFSSAILISSGAAAGDHLILRDANEAADEFTRNRAIEILSITDSTHLELDTADLDFGGGAAVATWEIRRSHLTNPSVSTPDYPSGATLYGKVSSNSFSPPGYSDGDDACELLEG